MSAGTTVAFTLAFATLGQGDWFAPFPAHRVIGNVYYVGSKDLASYLITTPEGHILIDSYPKIAVDFARTFDVLKTLPCDVFLGAHGGYYAMIEKYDRAQKGAEANPFVDPEGYRAYVAKKERAFRDALAGQERAKAADPAR